MRNFLLLIMGFTKSQEIIFGKLTLPNLPPQELGSVQTTQRTYSNTPNPVLAYSNLLKPTQNSRDSKALSKPCPKKSIVFLDPDQPDFDTKMLDYLSQFPLDDVDNEYIARNTMGRSRVAPNEIAGVRKIRQLKILITSMMADEIRNGEKGTGFGRYCYYGCHCLPDKHHNEAGFQIDAFEVSL